MPWLAELATAGWLPHLSPQMQAAVRIACAALPIGTVAHALPHAHRFFLSGRWGGYGESNCFVDAIQNRIVTPMLTLLNPLVWSTAIAIGLLALVPSTRQYAGLLLATTSAVIASQIICIGDRSGQVHRDWWEKQLWMREIPIVATNGRRESH